MAAFVLGNGVSRQDISLSNLEKQGSIYGCNALYRDFIPKVLVATDTAISQEIQKSGYASQHRFYTRRPLPGLGAQVVPKRYFGFSSGPIALSIAVEDGNDPIYLLGFDMGPIPGSKFNNLYAGTEFYKPIEAGPTFTGNWIKQLMRVITDATNNKFVRVCGETTQRYPELDMIPNLSHCSVADFLLQVNTSKD
jgi:hypothetical protein